jgi:hypothetical protein
MGFEQYIWEHIDYPTEAAVNYIRGTVYFSFIVTESGCIDAINVLQSPNKLLSVPTYEAVEKTECNWIPGDIDSIPSDIKIFSSINFGSPIPKSPYEFNTLSEALSSNTKTVRY